jgi:uncharacterized damage-inducible protein DinB
MPTDPRYPVGRFEKQPAIDAGARAALIDTIGHMPERLQTAVAGLSAAELDTPYRDGGWTVRQVVHHLADSHMNAYIRMRLAATEDQPPVKTYEEKAWAELADSRTGPLDLSLPLVAALHARWHWWLTSLDAAAFARTVQHPEWGAMSMDDLLQIYAWHCRHHVAHITALRHRQGWS